MIPERELREAFCEIGRRCWTKGYVAANDGNFSFRLDANRVLVTPTMTSKGFLKPEDMVIVDLEGNQLEGTRKATSEVKIHLFIYRNRPDVHSVVHVHPPHATAFALTQRQVPKGILPEVELFLGEIPLAPYATTGTWEFAETIAPWVRTHDAFLLTNHGAVTAGQDPFDAYYKMETVDQYCRILLLAAPLGPWRTIAPEGMAELIAYKRKWGFTDQRTGDLYHEGATPAPDAIRTAPLKEFVPHPGPLVDGPKAPRS